MQFGILGPLEVRSSDGDAVPVGGPRPRALLVMLLLNAGRVVGVEQIVAGQYGDSPPAGAANAVQAHVSRLRRSLSTDLIELRGAGYRLVVDPDDVDAHRFERLAGEGRRLLAAGNHAAAAAALREALALWRGPALVELPDGEAQRVRLEELRMAATEDLTEAELALPEGASIAELRRLVSVHPLRERLRGQLMRALYAAGRQAEALVEFEEARRLLAEELGADPSPELAAAHLSILRAEEPAPRTRQGLAAQFTSFVGREDELARLDALRDARLVTILGPGGVGKTRLAIESAARGPREVCFTDLCPLDDADQVSQAVLGAFGLRESGFQPAAGDPVRRLVAALSGQEALLILDNCEHLVDAVAVLARTLLARCPGLTILATSREALGLTGEHLLPLAPLGTAPRDVEPADARAYPAVRLFADRAAAVRPGFAVDGDNVGTVGEICAMLDGLPLAIEVAAARLRQFTVAELAARLAEHSRFRLLSRGDRTVAARHRTLHAVVEWSWDLLGEEERVLARRFAVFAGGASQAAVEAVCGVDAADDVLADLVDKSFMEIDGDRYRMLDLIRLFCAERLRESGERDAVQRAHARHHLALAQRADPHLRRAEQLDWLARLAAEHDNLMAAVRWAIRADRETAIRLVAALAAYWWLSGHHSQPGEAAAELLGEIPEGLEEEYVSCVVHAVPKAEPAEWARAEKIMRTLGRGLRYPFGAAMWGIAARPPDMSPPETERLLGSDPWNVALGQMSAVLVGSLDEPMTEGQGAMREALAGFRAVGERWGTAQALDWLALVASWRGEWSRAYELWAEALDLLQQLGALEECAGVYVHRGACLIRQGDLEAAGADYRRATALITQAGLPELPPDIPLGLGQMARLRGDTRAAAYLLGQALAIARSGGFGAGWIEGGALRALARLAETAGDRPGAARRYGEALEAARSSPLGSDVADAADGQAGAALLAGSPERAALLLGAAVALRGTAVAGEVDVARTAKGATDLLGATAFAAAYARGAAMTSEEALTTLYG